MCVAVWCNSGIAVKDARSRRFEHGTVQRKLPIYTQLSLKLYSTLPRRTHSTASNLYTQVTQGTQYFLF